MNTLLYDVLRQDFAMFTEDAICDSPLGSSSNTPDIASYLGQEMSAPGWGTSTSSLSYPLLLDAVYGSDPKPVATDVHLAHGGLSAGEAMSIDAPDTQSRVRPKYSRKEKPWVQPVLRRFLETKTYNISGVQYTIDPADYLTWSTYDKSFRKPYTCLLCAVEGRKHSSRQRSEIKKHFQILRHSYPVYGCPWCAKKWGRGSTDARHLESCQHRPQDVDEDAEAEDDAEDEETEMTAVEINKVSKKANEEVHQSVERRVSKPSWRKKGSIQAA